jgi:hypothetical protein
VSGRRGTRLYITDSTLNQNPHLPKLQEGMINLPALLRGE